MIVEPFPQPSALIKHAFYDLWVARAAGGEHRVSAEVGDDLTGLPRPWLPADCPSRLADDIWAWLQRVAAWINHEYSWQAVPSVPACWPSHPHIANELAMVACLRYDAALSLTPGLLEDWHRSTLPTFLDRLSVRIGPNGCPPGKHTDWPGASRYRDYHSVAATQQRTSAFTADQTERQGRATTSVHDEVATP